MPRTIALLTFGLAVTLTFAACDGSSSDATPTVSDGLTSVDVAGKVTIAAELALTPEERQLGLGERDALDPGAGMLFVFPDAALHSFCMCGMRFALDFIWIDADKRVVQLSQDVPPPQTTGGATEVIVPDQPVQYVLEVNAGVVAASGVAVGDEVTFEPEVSPEQAS
jgi:uncharacterized membrane protein (UPF0127 family)